MKFHCVDDGVPETTTRFLREACAARGVEYVHIDPRWFDFADERQLEPGAILFRPAISLQAIRVEQFLYADGVSTFYRDPDGIFFSPSSSNLLFQRAGLPIPRTYYVHNSARTQIDQWVEKLGGYPVVVKLMGYSRGLGVMRADSPESLYSLVDYTCAESKTPLLTSYVEDAVHWRLIVVGDQVVSGYQNRKDHNDFRTYADKDPADFRHPIRPELADVAVRAVQALRYEFGGVDVLEHPSGRLYLLESNFPCYFGTPQEVVGTDVSGAMLDHLIAKAARLAAARAVPAP
ncbi:MAG: RimK family alpha-L-glutamate ligase [Vicinamibacterales bacterium]